MEHSWPYFFIGVIAICMTHLILQRNPVSQETCRWNTIHPEAPNFTGNIIGLEYFDANFFKVHHHFANYMEPMSRKVVELAYQAIYDAGTLIFLLYIVLHIDFKIVARLTVFLIYSTSKINYIDLNYTV